MTAPHPGVASPAPACESCNGIGTIRTVRAGQPVRNLTCSECEGVGVSPLDWHQHIMWLHAVVADLATKPKGS